MKRVSLSNLNKADRLTLKQIEALMDTGIPINEIVDEVAYGRFDFARDVVRPYAKEYHWRADEAILKEKPKHPADYVKPEQVDSATQYHRIFRQTQRWTKGADKIVTGSYTNPQIRPGWQKFYVNVLLILPHALKVLDGYFSKDQKKKMGEAAQKIADFFIE